MARQRRGKQGRGGSGSTQQVELKRPRHPQAPICLLYNPRLPASAPHPVAPSAARQLFFEFEIARQLRGPPSSMASRGMMADSNFVGKGVLLHWLNTALQLRLEKVEDTCTGAVACQLMDCLHPGSVNMKKVDFNVKNEYEFVGNYKELQVALNKVGIKKEFNVSSLSRGKFQDNNEFMQWFKGYWDEVTGGHEVMDYDAVGRRQLCKTGDWKRSTVGGASSVAAAAAAAPRASSANIPAVRRTASNSSDTAAPAPQPRQSIKIQAAKPTAKPTVDDSQYRSQLAELNEQLTELKLKVETVERERDFYFDKLRDIEILCQAPELQNVAVLKSVEKILYAADAGEAKEALLEAQQLHGGDVLSADSVEPVAQEVQ